MKSKLNLRKKAVEPLIAAILLIVVAVILITIILSWGKMFTTSSLNKATVVELTQSDAESFIYPNSLKDGILQFNYSPPQSSSFGELVISSYKVISDSGETPDKNLSSSYTLKQGANYISLTSFSSLGLETNKKVTVILQTTSNQYLSIKNITNQFTAPVVNLPYVMYNNRKLYIQPSGSNADDDTGDEDTTFAWCDDYNFGSNICNPGTNFPAKEYCEDLNAHGYDDWYLPSYMQLAAMWNSYTYQEGDDCAPNGYITTDCINNTISATYNGDFVPLVSDNYWSSMERGADSAYILLMYNGGIANLEKYDYYYVRCVRDQ